MNCIKMSDLDLAGKRVLIREDLNVPIKDGIITSDQRLQAAIPTLTMALKQNAAVIVLSHLGRPKEGQPEAQYSLKPVANYLEKNLDFPVRFVKDYLNGVEVSPGELVLCENVRFNEGEKSNNEELSKQLASLCDVFVMDAFGTAHRAHASTCGVGRYAQVVAAGPLLLRELMMLERVLENPAKPIVAVVGGSKVSTKLSLLKNLVENIDILIPGGGIANTFLKAKGYCVGASLCEEELVPETIEIMDHAKQKGCEILLPADVVVGKCFKESCAAFNKPLAKIAYDDLIMDVGPETVFNYTQSISKAKTIIWNGPLGVFEFPQFAYGTRSIAIAIANSEAFSIAGGGDTLAAIDQYHLKEQISYVSTGGGAFLEYLEGNVLPAVAMLEARASSVLI